MNGPFRYDQVGSLLRTKELKKAKEELSKGSLNFEDYKKVEREEIKKIVLKQRKVGLKAITDGEFNREYWHYDFISYLNGIHNYLIDTNGMFHGVMDKLKAYYVEDKLSFPKDHPFIDDFKYLNSLCEKGEVAKVTIPGPNMIYFSGVINNPLFKENSKYNDIESVKKDIIKLYSDAIDAFYSVGCRYLQFDDTSWGALLSEKNREVLKERGLYTEKVVKEFSEITKESIKNKPNDMTITTHCCRGNFKSNWLYNGDYSYVEKEIFEAPFDGFFLEYDDERSGSLKSISNLKHGKLVLGLLTSKKGELENKKEIIKRIKEAEKYLPLEKMCLSCQCGFSSTEDGNIITEEEQFKKLALVKEIAKEVWKDQ